MVLRKCLAASRDQCDGGFQVAVAGGMITQPYRTRSLTKLDAVILTMVNAALKGDPKAQAALITMMRSLGLIGEPPQATNQEPFTPDDAALIEEYFQRVALNQNCSLDLFLAQQQLSPKQKHGPQTSDNTNIAAPE
jgi:hypothetical protein